MDLIAPAWSKVESEKLFCLPSIELPSGNVLVCFTVLLLYLFICPQVESEKRRRDKSGSAGWSKEEEQEFRRAMAAKYDREASPW
jgi:hypothetical protein